jgi:prepilin-type N-terminal cleavage/methylation domain-containing protein
MRQPGFSLVEALVVVGLLAIFAVIAVPRLAVPDNMQVNVPARQLAADLRLAQRLAIARHADYVLDFAPGSPPYTSYSVHASGGAAEPGFPKTIPAGVAATGPSQFTFHADGSAAAAGTVSLSSGAATATVQVIAATGRVVVVQP